MRILKENTLALIIDVQDRLFPHIYQKEILEKNLKILISGLKVIEIPILVTEQYPKGLGLSIPALKELLIDNTPIQKIAFSCCDEPVFMNTLADSGKQFIIIAGIESHVCVLQTVLDLMEKGYLPVVIEDCVSSRNPNDKKIAVKRMKQEGATISTYESILLELVRFSGTERFREISKLIK